jgi:hypothetical protein
MTRDVPGSWLYGLRKRSIGSWPSGRTESIRRRGSRAVRRAGRGRARADWAVPLAQPDATCDSKFRFFLGAAQTIACRCGRHSEGSESTEHAKFSFFFLSAGLSGRPTPVNTASTASASTLLALLAMSRFFWGPRSVGRSSPVNTASTAKAAVSPAIQSWKSFGGPPKPAPAAVSAPRPQNSAGTARLAARH